ncbi:MAG TPA: ABC transporter ATP-binding protein [Syntrophomonadaceae bacterium]|nr:ABC transporter ATP-binding protein [Syntrophomonadaceae bacterium]
MAPVLEVKGLTKVYKNGRGIHDISFEIERGEIYGFLGPNGAGKTTVMKNITGLVRADRGVVRILGFDQEKEFEKAMRHVGCIIENPAFYLYLSAVRNLEMIAAFYDDIDRTKIKEILDMVGLKQFQGGPVSQFSTGMRQRLALAAALLGNPDLLILDEPTNGLDIEGMADMRKLIIKLAARQKTTFFVSSHLAHEMELMCNRVGLINDGQMIAEGAVKELLKAHGSLEEFFIQQTQNDRGKAVSE